MQIIRIGHSGFLIRLEGLNMIFDYYTDKAGVITPEIFDGVKTCVFVTHGHGDHYNRKIFEWADLGDVEYVIDADCKIPKEPVITTMKEGESIELPHLGLTVKAFGSTDEGLSFLVQTKETLIFHAGDLNCWYWADEKTPEELKKSDEDYLKIIRKLPVNEIDVAFVPEDPRLEEHAGRSIMFFKEIVNPKRIISMHYPGNDGEVCLV